MKNLALFLFLSAASCYAQVSCTWFNSPAYQGVIPAFSTPGIEEVGYSQANLQWQCSGLSSGLLASYFRINYGTTTSYGSVYNYAPASVSGTVSDNRPVGGMLGGLQASTTYHLQGQSCVGGSDPVSCMGGNWYSTPDLSFTTTAAPTTPPVPSIPPLPINLSVPAMTGTHYVYGSNCGTTSGSTAAIVTANVQNCLNSAIPGDDIAFPPGVYPINQVYYPDQGIPMTCSASGTTCSVTSSGLLPATNSQIIIYPAGGIAPINQGYPYYVVSASGTTFSLAATLGGSAITFSTGSVAGTEFLPYPYPLTKSITIHSTASASQLPPTGVKLACSSLAQYKPYMAVFQFEDPTAQFFGGPFAYNAMSSGYYHTGIGFQVDSAPLSAVSAIDPPGYVALIGQNVDGGVWAQQNIAYNQVFVQASLPARSQAIDLDGANVALENSCVDGMNWWQPTYYSSTNTPPSTSGQTYNQPAVVWSWPGAAGVRQSVSSVAGSFTITGGTASGNVATWVNPADGSNHAQIPSGLTFTSSNITVHQYAAPAVVENTTGSTSHTYSCIPIGVQVGPSDPITITNSNATTNNTVTCATTSGATNYWIVRDGSVIGSNSGGVFTDTGQSFYGQPAVSIYTPTAVYSSSATGYNAVILNSAALNVVNWSITGGTLGTFLPQYSNYGRGYGGNAGQAGQAINGGAGYGPTAILDNDVINGNNIIGYFGTETFIQYTACATACVSLYTPGQVTIQRNLFTSNPLANTFNPNWDGQWTDGRNQPEKKLGQGYLVDGNVFDGIISSAGTGQCYLNYWIANIPPWLGYANNLSYSNFAFTNNTCLDLGAGFVAGANNNPKGNSNVLPAPTAHNILIKNNFIFNTPGGYGGWKTGNQYAPPGLTHYAYQDSTAGCPNGYSFVVGTLTEGMRLEHNTVRNANGCYPQAIQFSYQPFTGTVLNNLFEWTSDVGGAYGFTNPTFYKNIAGDGNDVPNCVNNSAVAMIANGCAPQMQWGGNLFLPTYANTFPGTGNLEFTSAQITSAIASVPASPASTWITYGNGATGSARLSYLQFFNTGATSSGGYMLTPSSPGISGAHITTDGLDVGADMNALAVAQGQVSNVRILSTTSTTATIGLYAPDSFACGVDWGTTAFYNGSGTWTRVAGSAGSPDVRNQAVTVTGVTAHALVYYRVNCASMQPTGTVQLP